MAKILFMTDADLVGSGYLNISIPLCTGLAKAGHDIIMSGLNYRGQQHEYPFRIIPTSSFQDFFAIFQNLANVWKFDVIMVALDVPVQMQLMKILKQYTGFQYKYVGIMPIEADPLCFSYAAALLQMDKVYIISQFGTDECLKMGIQAEHFQVGVDTSIWKPRTNKDIISSRQTLDISKDAFVMCTVADNQERKNLVAAMDAFSNVCKEHPNSKYVLVTREHNMIGWRLRDYAMEIGISRDFIIVERGVSQSELWTVMAAADVFVLPSKAEGLGMPLLEAMSMGIPCIATDACGMKELLDDDRGWLIDYEYVHRDPFGNGRRYWINKSSLSALLIDFAEIEIEDKEDCIRNSMDFVASRSWDIPINMVNKYLGGLDEQKS